MIYREVKDNFISNVIYSDRYLGRNYRKAGGLSYKLLGDNIGYIYYGSFSDGFSEDNLSRFSAISETPRV